MIPGAKWVSGGAQALPCASFRGSIEIPRETPT
jgi:hypothetical protein